MCIQNRYSSRCKHERSHAIVVTYALYTADSFLFALLVMLMLTLICFGIGRPVLTFIELNSFSHYLEFVPDACLGASFILCFLGFLFLLAVHK